MFRLTTVDFEVRSGRWLPPDGVTTADEGESIVVGREGNLPLAVSPVDPGVSRRALAVSVNSSQWHVEIKNSNHAWVHPWGRRPSWVESGTVLSQRWPRVGVLLIGNNAEIHHWVLLESDIEPNEWQKRDSLIYAGADNDGDETSVRGPLGGLTSPQLEAVQTVFSKHLAWPPVVATEPMLLEAAARRLRIAPSAVTDRLKQAQNRAFALGPHRQAGVTNPEYVYVLASAGYLPVPSPFRPGSGAQ